MLVLLMAVGIVHAQSPPRDAAIYTWPASGIVRVSEFVKTDAWRLQVTSELLMQSQDPNQKYFVYFRETRQMFTFATAGNGPERILDCHEGFYNIEMGWLYTNQFRAMVFGISPTGQYIANTNGVVDGPITYNFRLGVGSITDASEYARTVFQSTLTLNVFNKHGEIMQCDFAIRYMTKSDEERGEYRDANITRFFRPGHSLWTLSTDQLSNYVPAKDLQGEKIKYLFLPNIQPFNIQRPVVEQ